MNKHKKMEILSFVIFFKKLFILYLLFKLSELILLILFLFSVDKAPFKFRKYSKGITLVLFGVFIPSILRSVFFDIY